MLSLTKKSEYALVAVAHLARVGDRVVSARELAELHQVPLPLLMNVLKQLNQAGYVRSVRGARGGYALAIEPGDLTLAALIRAVEGPVSLVNCAPVENGTARGCRRSKVCCIREPVIKVHQELLRFLEGVTLADIAFDDGYRAHLVQRRSGKAVAR